MHSWHQYQTFSVAAFPLSLLTSTPVYNVWVFWYESDTCSRLAEMWKQHLPHSSNPVKLTCIIFCMHPCEWVKGCGVDVAGGCGAWIRRASTPCDKHQTTRWASCNQACVSILFLVTELGAHPPPQSPHFAFYTRPQLLLFFSSSVDRSWCRLLVIKSEQSSNV